MSWWGSWKSEFFWQDIANICAIVADFVVLKVLIFCSICILNFTFKKLKRSKLINVIKKHCLHLLWSVWKYTINIFVLTRHGLNLTILFKLGRLKVNFVLKIWSKFAHNPLFICESRKSEFCLRGHYNHLCRSCKPIRTKHFISFSCYMVNFAINKTKRISYDDCSWKNMDQIVCESNKFPSYIYLLKLNNRNTRIRCEICLVNSEQSTPLVSFWVSLSLTLNIFYTFL